MVRAKMPREISFDVLANDERPRLAQKPHAFAAEGPIGFAVTPRAHAERDGRIFELAPIHD